MCNRVPVLTPMSLPSGHEVRAGLEVARAPLEVEVDVDESGSHVACDVERRHVRNVM